MSMIRAAISPSILSKADRLFRNDDAGVFVELLQNARRAGATRVTVRIEPIVESTHTSNITFHDNGRRIEDFQKLLTLGESDWSAEVRAEEDPAGMGFFSLCHSTVEVWSGNLRTVLSREVFLGGAEAEVERVAERMSGTRIIFTRASGHEALGQALTKVSEFGPIEVQLNGEPVVRHDFLEGSLHREVIDGVEVGFGPSFRWNCGGWRDDNWNFHGSVIGHDFGSISGLLTRNQFNNWETNTLHMRFNVLEVGRVKLQLPDRRAIVQNDQLNEFERKVRAAAYRFLGTQERHVLSFKNWSEARSLDVTLPEASPLLDTWHAATLDDSIDPFFGLGERHLLSGSAQAMIVASEIPNQHTLEAALQNASPFDKALFRADRSFEGYTWYDALPVVIDTSVAADGIPFDEWSDDSAPRPETLTVAISIRQANLPDTSVELPAAIHVVGGDDATWDSDGPEFVAVRKSPWDNETLDGPFDVVQFLVAATFCSSDDASADSFDTQRDYYEAHVQREVDGYFRGPRAALMGILHNSLSWEARQYAFQIGVAEIHFKRQSGDANGWTVELIQAEDVPVPTVTG